MNTFHVGHTGTNPRVSQSAVLTDTLALQARRPDICERICARIIVIGIAANESPQREYRGVAQDPGPRRRDIKRPDLRALIGGAKQTSGQWIDLTRMQFLVVRIGVLKPRARKA